MKILKLLSLFVLLLIVNSSFAQEKSNRLKILNIHAGPSMSSFMNAEAPHKTFIFSEDYTTYAISAEGLEHDYNVKLLRDAQLNFVAGISFEYFIKERWSVVASLNYEGKGIHIEDGKTEVEEWVEYTQVREETFDIEISNQYLTLPMTARWYFGGNNLFYLQGGMYMGYLLKSEVDIEILGATATNAFINNELSELTTSQQKSVYGIALEGEDEDKDFTSNFDFGLNFGGGINYPLSERIYLNADLLLSVGLKKLDKKNNNDYEEIPLPGGSGFRSAIRSANYYGLNSKAKNISGALTIGIGLKL